MARTSIWITIIAVIAAFVAGFAFANYLNRSELTSLKGENERLQTSPADPQSQQGLTLSEEEITAKLAEAEKNSGDFTFQRNLGIGLYRYGAIKQDASIIERSIPVLVRANGLEPKNYDVIVALGNAFYDVAYFSKDTTKFDEARKYYNLALGQRPDDLEVRTDLGLTYFLQTPPDYTRALAEFDKSLSKDPRHEKTLAFAALATRNLSKDHSKYSTVLRSVNANNPTLRELDAGQPAAPQQ